MEGRSDMKYFVKSGRMESEDGNIVLPFEDFIFTDHSTDMSETDERSFLGELIYAELFGKLSSERVDAEIIEIGAKYFHRDMARLAASPPVIVTSLAHTIANLSAIKKHNRFMFYFGERLKDPWLNNLYIFGAIRDLDITEGNMPTTMPLKIIIMRASPILKLTDSEQEFVNKTYSKTETILRVTHSLTLHLENT